ncbi:MAG TPA: hypothetical protein VME67_18905 [Mycobacterium sp.]|nr:hypothetical protein [Mycobacterium sp.]HTX96739.1 hypothetical protein [Mycobacterium sp.]
MSSNTTIEIDPSAALSAPARDQLVEKVAEGLAGSLNVRRTALRLLTLIRPQLADWSLVVLLDSRTGGCL